METKICLGCEIDKPLTDYYVQVKKGANGKRWNYRDTRCRDCRTLEHAARRRSIKKQAIEYLGGHCVKCGYAEDFPEVYDFHHVDPSTKDYDIFKSVKAFEVIKPELDKCILLCANCHRKEHANWNSP